VPHHLIDIINPDESFDAALFRDLAVAAINDIRRRGKTVIVCGGTGLYLRALTRGLFTGPGRDAALRSSLSAEADRAGLSVLYRRLETIDPQSVSRIHPNDRQRIIRALEVFQSTGKPISAWQKEHGFAEAPFDTLLIGIERQRAELYRLIDERCERMVAEGLLQEVEALAGRGYGLELKPLQSIGYKHMGLVLKGLLAREEALTLMKRDTRRLAKQQLTWFRADRAIRWFRPDQRADVNEAAERFLRDGPEKNGQQET
jgi:tRNA dimethylallyltransferase